MSTWFHQIVTSHGWYQLSPFRYEGTALERVHSLPDGRACLLTITADGDQLTWTASEPVDGQEAAIHADVARMFSQHWPLDDFYTLLSAHPRYTPAITHRWGRLLVGPTVWEDLVKTLLTTNTTWTQTRQMVHRVCAFGTPYAGRYTFPTPQQILSVPVDEFTQQARLGYRAASLVDLAERVHHGLDVESWRSLDATSLYRQVIALAGFGDYAASTMLRLLGHFDRLAIDSECRATYRYITHRTDFTDKDIREHYAPFGHWQGLVSWIDIMYREELHP